MTSHQKAKILSVLIALAISLIFGLPHLLIPHFLGGFKYYQPLAADRVPLLTSEEISFAAQAREIFDGHLLISDYHLAEYKNSLPSLLFLSPFLIGSLARLAGSVETVFIISDFFLPPMIFLVICLLLFKLTSAPLISSLGGVLILTANRLFQFIPPLTIGMAQTLWHIFIIDGSETAPLEFSCFFHPQLVFVFLILHLYFLFLALKSPACLQSPRPSVGRRARSPTSCRTPRRWNLSLFSWSCILSSIFLGSLFYSYFYYWTFALAGEAVLLFILLFQKNFPRFKILASIIAIALLLSIPYWFLFFKFRSLPQSTDILERVGLEVGRIRNVARTAQYLIFALIFSKLIKKKDFSFWFLLSFLIGGIICLNLQLLTGYTLQSWHWTIRAINPWSIIMLAYLAKRSDLLRKANKMSHLPRSKRGRSDLKKKGLVSLILTVLILIFLLRAFLLQAVVAKNTYQGYALPKTTLEAFDWLNQNTANDSVVLTPSFETLSLLSAYTHNSVFLPNGATTLASNEEIIKRLLITYKIFQLKKDNLEKILTYSGTGLESELLEQRAVTVLFHMKYLKKSEGLSSWSAIFEIPPGVQQEILTAYEELLKKPALLPADFRLDYIYYGPAERKIKEIDLSQYRFVKEVFSNQDVTIYKVISSSIIKPFYFRQLGIQKVLDVGCGIGLLVEFLNENGFETIGCDSAKEALKIARKRDKKSSFVRASAAKLPFRNQSFGVVTAIALVEHLTPKEAKEFIAEARRVLKPQGYFFLVTPNLLSPMRLLRGKKWFAYSDPTHVTFYTPFSLTRLLKQAGFSHFRFWFKIPKDLPFDWWFADRVEKFPIIFKNLISFLLLSTPLALIRESFYLCARKSSPR